MYVLVFGQLSCEWLNIACRKTLIFHSLVRARYFIQYMLEYYPQISVIFPNSKGSLLFGYIHCQHHISQKNDNSNHCLSCFLWWFNSQLGPWSNDRIIVHYQDNPVY